MAMSMANPVAPFIFSTPLFFDVPLAHDLLWIEQVDRDLDEDRSRDPFFCLGECLIEERADRLDLFDRRRPLGHRAHQEI